MHQHHLESLLKLRLLGPTHGASDSIRLGGVQEFLFSNKLPDDIDAAGLGTTLRAAQKQNLNASWHTALCLSAPHLSWTLPPSQMQLFSWIFVFSDDKKNFFNQGEIHIREKLTILKCIIQWHLAYSQCYAPTPLLVLNHFCHPHNIYPVIKF